MVVMALNEIGPTVHTNFFTGHDCCKFLYIAGPQAGPLAGICVEAIHQDLLLGHSELPMGANTPGFFGPLQAIRQGQPRDVNL